MNGLTHYARAVWVVGICAVVAAPASGATMAMLLQDDNSEVVVDPSAGMTSWVVDGIEQVSRQWFWYRLGTEPETPITLLQPPDPASGTTDSTGDGLADVAYLLYHGPGFDVEVKVSLDGGPAGSSTSDVLEQVTVTNTGGDTLDFHFYQFADFDLGGTTSGDTVVHLGNGAQGDYTFDALQVTDEWTLRVTENASEPMAHCEASDPLTLNTLLNDGAYTRDLNDTEQAGPGDVAWAYQWDFVLGPDEAFLLSKDKMITPEPATLALLGSGAAVALLLRRRR